MVEQLICTQRVGGSAPSAGSNNKKETVNYSPDKQASFLAQLIMKTITVRHYHKPCFRGVDRDYGYAFRPIIWTGAGQNIPLAGEYRTSEAAIKAAAEHIKANAVAH